MKKIKPFRKYFKQGFHDSCMKKWVKIFIVIIIILVLIGIFGFFIKPSTSSISKCEASHNSGLAHIDRCFKACCEKPFFLKLSCNKFCYNLN